MDGASDGGRAPRRDTLGVRVGVPPPDAVTLLEEGLRGRRAPVGAEVVTERRGDGLRARLAWDFATRQRYGVELVARVRARESGAHVEVRTQRRGVARERVSFAGELVGFGVVTIIVGLPVWFPMQDRKRAVERWEIEHRWLRDAAAAVLLPHAVGEDLGPFRG